MEIREDSTAILAMSYPCPIEWDGIIYPTLGHAYHASRTQMVTARKMIALGSYGQAIRMSKMAKRDPNWSYKDQDILYQLLVRKFQHGTELSKELMDTNPEMLIYKAKDDYYLGEHDKSGRNIYGRLLMRRRYNLIKTALWG